MTDDIIPYSCPKIKGFFKILEIFFVHFERENTRASVFPFFDISEI
jgi:hypothetical protein